MLSDFHRFCCFFDFDRKGICNRFLNYACIVGACFPCSSNGSCTFANSFNSHTSSSTVCLCIAAVNNYGYIFITGFPCNTFYIRIRIFLCVLRNPAAPFKIRFSTVLVIQGPDFHTFSVTDVECYVSTICRIKSYSIS